MKIDCKKIAKAMYDEMEFTGISLELNNGDFISLNKEIKNDKKNI